MDIRRTLGYSAVLVALITLIQLNASGHAEAPSGKSEPDAKLIQGEWLTVSGREGGKDTTDQVKGLKVIFSANELTFRPRIVTDDPIKVNYKLDPSQSPKRIDTTHEIDVGKPINQLGIYELDGDNLKLCLEASGKRRPSTFEAKGNESAVLLVLKRANAPPK